MIKQLWNSGINAFSSFISLKVWNLTNCRLKTNHLGHTGYLNNVTVSPDGSLCASGGKVQYEHFVLCSQLCNISPFNLGKWFKIIFRKYALFCRLFYVVQLTLLLTLRNKPDLNRFSSSKSFLLEMKVF